MDSEITVFIPSYNPGKFLMMALKSVYCQSYSNWKLILVDDCSTDDSLVMAKELLEDPRITVVKNKVNLGQSKAQNVALELITTPYCLQLDSDDWIWPNTLEVLVEEFKKQPEEVAVISGNVLVLIKGEESLDPNNKFEKSYIRKSRPFDDGYDFMLSHLPLQPRCYRTSALKSINGWPTDDPYEGRHMEDTLILFRLIEHYRFHWIDKLLYVYRRHENNDTNNLDIYNEVIEWNIKNALKRWGDKYEPVFKMTEYGWKNVVKLNPKKEIED